MKNKLLKKKGEKVNIKKCVDKVQENGLLSGKDDEDYGIIDGLMMVIKLLGSKKDIFIFGITCFFLFSSQYFEIYALDLTGHVLNSFSENDSLSVINE